MKKFTLISVLLVISSVALAQQCLVISSAFFTNPSFDGVTFNLSFTYTAVGNKSVQTTVSCHGTPIFNDCFTTNGSGSHTYTNLVCPSGINGISAVFTPHTGNCGAAACGAVQVLPAGGGPLALKLISFSALRTGQTVKLHWQTETDPETKDFLIERADRNEFQTVGTVAAAGQMTGADYTYTDKNINPGITQYRLKITEQSGVVSYSDIKLVKGFTPDDINIYPNPGSANGKINVSGISENTQLEMTDLTGRTIFSRLLENRSSVDLPSLQKGMYLLRFINKTTGGVIVKKLTVVR